MSLSIRDVAAKANVAPVTVSSVLNNRTSARISKATQEHVRRIAEEMGYQPNPLAQRLLNHKNTQTIGLMLSELGNPFFQEVFEGIEKAVIDAGYQIMLDVNTSGYGEYHELRRLSSWLVDGVLMWAPAKYNLAHYLGPQASNIPVVYLGHLREDGTDAYSFDLCGAGRQAAEHLLSRGRRRLCYVSLFSREHLINDANHQMPAMVAVCNEAGLELEVVSVVGTPLLSRWAFDTGHAIAVRPKANRPDAVICYNDLTALYVYHGLLDAGLRVPEDIALMGFDGIDMTKHLPHGPLTTVRMPVEVLCRAAVDTLCRRIAGDHDIPLQQVLIPAELSIGATA